MTEPTYSRVSTWAVISAISGIAASLGLLALEFAGLAALGVFAGIAAIHAIRKYELSGYRPAVFGLVTSLSFAVATPLWDRAQFRSESLPEYARLDFAACTQPGGPSLDRLIGAQVCLKGYAVEPGFLESMESMDQLILSPRGDGRNKESQIIVELGAWQTWNWSSKALAVSGTLIANPQAKANAALPKFVLRHSTVRESRTGYDLANRVPGKRC